MHRPHAWVQVLAAVAASAAVFTAVLTSEPAYAKDYTLKELRIVQPYARATPPGARTAGAYFRIENRGNGNDELVRAASPLADSVELHLMRMDGNVARMRAVNRLGIPAGAVVTLAPNGYHVMLVGLKRPLVAGDRFPLTLTFAKAGAVDIDVDVIALTAPAVDDDAHSGTRR